jgi:serine/threonine protein kinase
MEQPETIGRYQILSEIGRGGMATVYLGHDPSFDRDVAIKVLPREFTHDPTFRERFEREARTIARLEHSAIVPVYDVGSEDGLSFLVMRYMPGGSLAERIERGPIPVAEVARILADVSAGLDEAHAKGIVHRDLKPGNILFDRAETACLSDFGIVKLAEASAALTGTGIVGTPSYMSPEQARGDPDIDHRSDIYALGVIAYEMLTGKAPYEADTPMGVAIKHILDPVPEILSVKPDLPAAIGPVIKRALAKDRGERYPTSRALAEAISAVAEGMPVPEWQAPAPSAALHAPAPPSAPPEEDESYRPETLPIAPPAPPAHKETTRAEESTDELSSTDRLSRQEQRAARRAARQARRAERPGSGCFRWFIAISVVTIIILGIMAVTLLSGLNTLGEIFASGVATREETQHEAITEELGEADSLEVTLKLAAVRADVDGQELPDLAVQGEYDTNTFLSVTTDYAVEDGVGELTIEQQEAPDAPEGMTIPRLLGLTADLSLALNNAVPIDLTVNTGVGETNLDLRSLDLSALSIEAGVGTVDLRLPAGSYEATMNAGVGSATIELPEDGAVDLRVLGGLGDIEVTDSLESVGENHWQSPGYEDAEQQIDLTITAGVGDLTVID